jgi:hypothetical protein
MAVLATSSRRAPRSPRCAPTDGRCTEGPSSAVSGLLRFSGERDARVAVTRA